MSRALVLIDGAAAIAGAAGLTMLARPAAAGRLLRLPEGEASVYALRIAGAMVFAAALFAAGFATAFSLAGGRVNGVLLFLLVGVTAGIAFTVADMLVAPVVRGWRDDSRVPDRWTLLATPGTLAARLLDSLVAILLVAGVLLAFLLAGVL